MQKANKHYPTQTNAPKYELFKNAIHSPSLNVVKVIAWDSTTNEYTCKLAYNEKADLMKNVKETDLTY